MISNSNLLQRMSALYIVYLIAVCLPTFSNGVGCLCEYGGNCGTDVGQKPCCPGLKCILNADKYPICLEDPAYKNGTSPNPSFKCVNTNAFGCFLDTDCCNPGTTCMNGKCVLLCTHYPTAAPTHPTIMPTIIPSFYPTIAPSTHQPTVPTIAPTPGAVKYVATTTVAIAAAVAGFGLLVIMVILILKYCNPLRSEWDETKDQPADTTQSRKVHAVEGV